jgi:hypothetical protein
MQPHRALLGGASTLVGASNKVATVAPTFSAVLELFAFLVTLCAAGAFTKLRMTSLVRRAARALTWGFAAPRAADAAARSKVGEILAGAMLGPPLAAFQRYPRRARDALGMFAPRF